MFIQTEQTPNPQTLKFLPGKVVMDDGTAFFQNIGEAADSPFAKRLFDVDGVEGVFFGSDFITVTKSENTEWNIIKTDILTAIMDHFKSGEPIISGKLEENNVENLDGPDGKIIFQIKELLDTRVRPAVAQDGGDITFHGFENGIVFLHMQGACAGCPSSTMTLKMGIENLLKHYIPEVEEVRPIPE